MGTLLRLILRRSRLGLIGRRFHRLRFGCSRVGGGRLRRGSLWLRDSFRRTRRSGLWNCSIGSGRHDHLYLVCLLSRRCPPPVLCESSTSVSRSGPPQATV